MEDFKRAVNIAITGLDKVITYGMNFHALQAQKDMAYNYRNTGLGIMGVASMFVKMGFKYGDEKSKDIIDRIMFEMFRQSVISSSNLAKELGSFPKYKSVVFDSEIIKNHFSKEEIEDLKKNGLRNCSLNSIAPSGSIATMLNVSTGCESYFKISYKRKTESLHKDQDVYYDVYVKEATEYINKYGVNNLPDYFVDTSNIEWQNRIDMQSIMQNHVDTAISSTVNLPNNTTVEEVMNLYLYAWEKGLKGVTIYRAGCAREGILSTSETTSIDNSEVSDNAIQYDYITPVSRKQIGTTSGNTYCKKTACGTMYITINKDVNGNVVESFVSTSKAGICSANLGAINRMISVGLRAGVKVEEIADQLRGINCSACTRVNAKGEKLDGISCPDILGKTLLEFYNNNKIDILNPIKSPVSPLESSTRDTSIKGDTNSCPDCGEPLRHEGGCIQCTCGFSKCS